MTPQQRIAMPLGLTVTHQALGAFFILSVPATVPYFEAALSRPELVIGLFPSVAYLMAMVSSVLAYRCFPRFGPLGTSNFAILIGLAGYLCLAVTTSWAFLIGAILMGIAYGPLNPSSSVVLYQLAPLRQRNVVFSLKQSGVPLGGAVAGLTLPFVANRLDYTGTIVVTAVMVAAILIAFWQQSHRIDTRLDTPGARTGASAGAMFHFGCQLLAAASFCYSFIQLVFSAFLGLIAYQFFDFSPVAAGVVLAVFHVSGIIGRPLWGLIADRLRRWWTVLPAIGVLTAVLTAALVPLIRLDNPDPLLFYVLAAALGLCASGWNGVYVAELANAVPSSALGSITGKGLSVTFAGVVIGPITFGFMLETSGATVALLGLAVIGMVGAGLGWAGVAVSRRIVRTGTDGAGSSA